MAQLIFLCAGDEEVFMETITVMLDFKEMCGLSKALAISSKHEESRNRTV